MIAQPATGQWFVASDGQRWWFDPGSIAFDFAYTGGFSGPPEWEHWHEPADLARWWRERFGATVTAGLTIDEAGYQRARELRAAIARAMTATASDRPIEPADADLIDHHAAMPDLPPQLGAPIPATPDRLLAAIAREAAIALSDPERVRSCAAADCGLIYLDTSRSGNRTWCSMRRCGNRHKVRQLRARRAATTKEEQR
ncbi:MAG TPA: CGNR zinc finger domain-containing protein [Natronosporangium sp.]